MLQLKLTEQSRHKLNYAVFPILRSDLDGTISFLGTGFFITNIGLLLTAKHVLMDVIDIKGNPIAALSVLHFVPENIFYHRQIIRFYTHAKADLAIGVLAPMHHNITKQPLINEHVTLTHRHPPMNESILTFAYPLTKTMPEGAGTTIHTRSNEYTGSIIESLPNGRDQAMLPGPCFRTDMSILHGASGGPVLDTRGHVFGVNSTGFDGTSDFYVSSVEPLLEMEITDVMLSGIGYREKVRVDILVGLGHIPMTAG